MNVRGAWWATVAFFLLHGLIVATWVSRIPAVQTVLKLNNGVLGSTLLCSALGAAFTIPFTGMLINRYGSKRVTSLSTMAFSAALILPALAPSGPALGVALFVFGGTAAAMDVSMNAQGVEVEKRMRRPTMSRFHGMFSLGAMVGAAVGGFVAAHGIGTLAHFSGSAVVYLAVTFIFSPLMIESHEQIAPGEHRLPFNKIPPVLLALSGIGFCILLSEGAMADWTAVYLKQVLRAGPGTAAAGYSVFSAAMAAFRFLGDWITSKLGALTAVRCGSILGGCGLTWALCMSSPGWAMPGFALVGMGFSIIIPLVFGSGGRVDKISPGVGIATVTGIGYLGFIVGPPLIGFVSQAVTLRYALYVVVACCAISAVLSGSLRNLRSH